MEKQLNNLTVLISRRALADLTTEVKETLAFGANAPARHAMTEAQLWHIQRQVKQRNTRRFL